MDEEEASDNAKVEWQSYETLGNAKCHKKRHKCSIMNSTCIEQRMCYCCCFVGVVEYIHIAAQKWSLKTTSSNIIIMIEI